eukprot:1118804-Prorocentrum_lima.AAC.1
MTRPDERPWLHRVPRASPPHSLFPFFFFCKTRKRHTATSSVLPGADAYARLQAPTIPPQTN